MAEVILYPDAHPETITVDGVVNNVDTYTTDFLILLDAAGNYHFDEDVGLQIKFSTKRFLGVNYWDICSRSILTFDCTPIPLGSTILSATLHLHGIDKVNEFPEDFAMNVYEAYPDNNNDLVNADYQHIHSAPLAIEITYPNWLDNDWNVFTLNPAGLALVIPGQITRLGLRESLHDVARDAPTLGVDLHFLMPCYSADKGDPYRPYLEVTYTAVIPTVTTNPATRII